MILEHNTSIEISNPIGSYCKMLLDPILQNRLYDRLQDFYRIFVRSLDFIGFWEDADRFCIAPHRIRYRIESPGWQLPMNSLEILIMEKTIGALRKYLIQEGKNRRKTYMHITNTSSLWVKRNVHIFILSPYGACPIWTITQR
jgi:hypothetical protein